MPSPSEPLGRIRRETVQQQAMRICREIKLESYALTSDHVDEFLKVANDSEHCIQNMAPTVLQRMPENYIHYATTTTDGVQIIYEGTTNVKQIEKNTKSNRMELGHFVCVHYVMSRQTVYIYDPLYTVETYVDNPNDKKSKKKINTRTREIIQNLYPDQ